MHTGGEHVLAEIRQPQQYAEADTTHAAHQCTFLCIDAVGKTTLGTGNMHFTVPLQVVGFLKNGDKICPCFPQHRVFVSIHGVHFQPDRGEIFLGNADSFRNVFRTGNRTAFTGEQQYLPHAGFGDVLHFRFDFRCIQLAAGNGILAVEAAVNALVFAVVGDVQRCEQQHIVAEVLFPFFLCPPSHLFQKRLCRRGEQCRKILERQHIFSQCRLYLFGCILFRLICRSGSDHMVKNVRIDLLHVGLIFHRVINLTHSDSSLIL